MTLQVADAYFRAGADKISIGSDAVDVARAWLASGKADGSTSIEQISHVRRPTTTSCCQRMPHTRRARATRLRPSTSANLVANRVARCRSVCAAGLRTASGRSLHRSAPTLDQDSS